MQVRVSLKKESESRLGSSTILKPIFFVDKFEEGEQNLGTYIKNSGSGLACCLPPFLYFHSFFHLKIPC